MEAYYYFFEIIYDVLRFREEIIKDSDFGRFLREAAETHIKLPSNLDAQFTCFKECINEQGVFDDTLFLNLVKKSMERVDAMVKSQKGV